MRTSRLLLVLGLAWILVRGAAVLALGDVFVYAEELEKGAAAIALGADLDVEHHRLAYHYYEGGGFVVSHLNALWFALVGPSLLAHKLNALLFGLLTLLVASAWAARWFGPLAGWTCGLLLVFAPESFQKLSLLNLGIHFQALLFVACVIALGTHVLFEPRAGRRAWFGLGLAVGFGTYFSYQVALPALAVALAVLVVRRGRLRADEVACGAAGALLGAVPWIVMALLVGGEVLDVHGHGGLARPPAEQLATLRAFVQSIFADRALPGAAAVVLFALAAVAAAVASLRGESGARGPHRLVAWSLLVVTLAYATSSFAVGEVYHWILFQRASLVWFLATLAIAAAVGRAAGGAQRGPRVASLAVTAALLLAGARASWAVMQQGQPGTLGANLRLLTETRGVAWAQYVGKLRSHLEGDAEHQLVTLLAIDEPPAAFYPQLATHLLEDVPLEAALELCRRHGGADWRELVRGLGWSLLAQNGFDPRAAFAASRTGDPEVQDLLAEALGRVGRGGHATLEGLPDELALGEELDAPESWFVGLGHRLLQVKGDRRPRGYFRRTLPVFLVHPRGAEAWLDGAPASRLPALERGYRRARELSRLGSR